MKYITVKLTEHQIGWIISTIEFDEMHGSKDEGIRGFRKRLLTILVKASKELTKS